MNATSCSDETGSPSQMPERWRVPWIVRAVVPGSSSSPACASASAHLVGVVTESTVSHCSRLVLGQFGPCVLCRQVVVEVGHQAGRGLAGRVGDFDELLDVVGAGDER